MQPEEVAKDGESVDAFCRALKTGDVAEAERLFTKFMDKTISIRDTAVKKEFKENLDTACEGAMRQIEDNDYTAELRQDDMQTILKYGIACYKKRCKLVMQKE